LNISLDLYKASIRPLIFSGAVGDPEQLHHLAIHLLQWLDQQEGQSGNGLLRRSLAQSCCYRHPVLSQTLWGLEFPNPIGLAAGFDKDGVASSVWSDLGFGFAELGTVTFHAQPGNPQPRLFRLPQDQAILNRMGFNNQGAAVLAGRLRQKRDARKGGRGNAEQGNDFQTSIPLGINLGKSKITPLEEAAKDYLASFQLLKELGDYFVVNVSSPNTPGLRSLQATEQLSPILAMLQQENQAQKPLLIKIAPDLGWEEIEAVIELAQKHHLAGIIATNTTISRSDLNTQVIGATGKPITEEAGGISGAPVKARSTEIIRFIYRQTQGTLPIIGVGGIFTADDVWEKITAGATLVQIYTGWIYEGPWMLKRLLRELAQKLQAQNLPSIQAAIGMQSQP
jgi:dihydroorotate dehydrogenase